MEIKENPASPAYLERQVVWEEKERTANLVLTADLDFLERQARRVFQAHLALQVYLAQWAEEVLRETMDVMVKMG